MVTGPVGPVEVFFYWPEAILGNFYWPAAIGPLLASSPVPVLIPMKLYSNLTALLTLLYCILTLCILL